MCLPGLSAVLALHRRVWKRGRHRRHELGVLVAQRNPAGLRDRCDQRGLEVRRELKNEIKTQHELLLHQIFVSKQELPRSGLSVSPPCHSSHGFSVLDARHLVPLVPARYPLAVYQGLSLPL